MVNDGKSTSPQPISRTISHNQRAKSSDVNPLLQSSSQVIVSADDNYVVGRQKMGQLHNIVPGFKLSFKEGFFNSFGKYYEVDKRTYPFDVTFNEMASAQATFKFNVKIEFTLKVVDPCIVVKENLTSLLDCIQMDLKNMVCDITSLYPVRKTYEARMSLVNALISFNCPSFLEMNCGIVDIKPDADAFKMLRELEQQNLEVELITKKEQIDSKQVFSKKRIQNIENLEEHEIPKLIAEEYEIPKLIEKPLNSEANE